MDNAMLANQKTNIFKPFWTLFSFLLFFMIMEFAPSSGALSSAYAQAGGNLQITPTRIVFEGRDRSAVVNLMNQGTTTETYRISFKNMRMLDNGDYKNIEKPGQGEKFAEGLIRYSPRQVTLKPGEAQTVRLLLRKKKGLEEGEYRSHLLVRTVPPENTGESLEQAAGDNNQIRVQLIPVFGVSIPVIARHGKGSSSITIKDAKIVNEEGKDKLKLRLNRDGLFSTFGDMEVTLGAGGSDTVVSIIRGIAVYTPNRTRTVTLSVDPKVDVKGKTLHLVYRNVPEKGGTVIAEADVQIP